MILTVIQEEKTMKKLSVLLSVLFLMSLAVACSGNMESSAPEQVTSTTTQQTTTQQTTADTTGASAPTDATTATAPSATAPSATVTTTAATTTATTTATKPPVTTQPPTSTTAANQENNWPANPLSDFEYSTDDTAAGIEKYIGNAATVVIPEEIEGKPVVAVMSYAFFDNTTAETVILPDTVQMIWNDAFRQCTSLKKVVIGDGVTIILERAFRECTALEEVHIPKNVNYLGAGAFRECMSLKKVTLSSGSLDEHFGSGVFLGCPIEELVVEPGVKRLGSSACFLSCKIETLTIPASVEILGEYGFNETLKRVYFEGDAPKKIGTDPFAAGTVLYYDPDTAGWDTTPLKDQYELVAQ